MKPHLQTLGGRERLAGGDTGALCMSCRALVSPIPMQARGRGRDPIEDRMKADVADPAVRRGHQAKDDGDQGRVDAGRVQGSETPPPMKNRHAENPEARDDRHHCDPTPAKARYSQWREQL